VLKSFHFPPTGNSGFENPKLVLVAELPHTERYAHLRVVAFGTANDLVTRV